jgi:nucleoside-diphosphate-sugar epimerase
MRILTKHQIDGIIHLATEYGRNTTLSDIIESNVVFPLRLLDASQKQIKIFINTDSFFGKKQFDQSYLKEYTASKRILEKLLKSYDSDVKIVNMRLEHVYGDSDSEGKFFNSILKSLLTHQKLIELTAGSQRRDFVYVEDVAAAYTLVLKKIDVLKGYQEFEVGTGKCIPVKDFVSKLAQLTSSKSILNFGALPQREGDIEESRAENSNLKTLGWQCRYALDDAINLVIQKEKIRFNL